MSAGPWNIDFGYSYVANNESLQIFEAARTAFANAGTNQMGLAVSFGFIPFLFASMVFLRTNKITPTSFVYVVTNLLCWAFGLVPTWMMGAGFIVFTILLGIAIAYQFWN